MLRLLTRRRCVSCGDELPPSREYPMRVCATCILGPGLAAARSARRGAPDEGWRGPGDDEDDDCA